MSEQCANTAALNNYLRKLDEGDAREAIIEKRADALLLSEWAPDDPANFGEALGELSAEKIDALALYVGKAIDARLTPEGRAEQCGILGRMLADAVLEYCTERAKSAARRSVDDAECHRCHDEGCRHCAEPDERPGRFCDDE